MSEHSVDITYLELAEITVDHIRKRGIYPQRTGLGVAAHLGISFLCAYVALRAHRECSQLMEFFKRGVGGANARTSTAHARRVIQDFIDGERGNQGFGER